MTRAPTRRILALAVCAAMVAASPVSAQSRKPVHDYPTSVRADYVIGCMATAGFKREYLERCACGIDTIADMMPYEEYEAADTILRMQQSGVGNRGAIFRDTPVAKERTEQLRRAQAEVALQCK